LSTSDGISDEEWRVVQSYAEDIAEANASDIDDSFLVARLFSELKKLETSHGRLPSIIATEADYTVENGRELSLLKEAYVTACEIDDVKNISYVSSSLAEYYIETVELEVMAGYWLRSLLNNLKNYTDEYLESVCEDVKEALNK